jgi:hypothetical protein
MNTDNEVTADGSRENGGKLSGASLIRLRGLYGNQGSRRLPESVSGSSYFTISLVGPRSGRRRNWRNSGKHCGDPSKNLGPFYDFFSRSNNGPLLEKTPGHKREEGPRGFEVQSNLL